MKRCILLFSCMLTLPLLSCGAAVASNDSAGLSKAADPNTPAPAGDRLHEILSSMHDATQKLQSAQSEISYLTIQDPDLLDSRILRTGTLYYLKNDGRSYLRIQFKDLKQDDFQTEPRRDEYLFDGVWLTRIDYTLRQIDMFQQAPEDKPADVFELIRHNFPLLGFSDIKGLKQDFEIALQTAPEDPNDTIHLLLKTKPDSPFSQEYSKIDFWIDKNLYTPQRIRAYSVPGDIYDIRFKNLQPNKKLEKGVFAIEKPADFRENIEPLKENRK